MTARACILGCSGPELTSDETAFFRDADPWGFILFKRNIDNPDQVRALTASLRACVGRADAPVLIDQEGGRVQRMGPPHWRRYPPGRAYGAPATGDPLAGRELARLGARLIAHDLLSVGITVDCLPVLDVPASGAHDIIGDRAYGERPARHRRARPGRRGGPARRRRAAGDQAHARARPGRGRQPRGAAGGRCPSRGARARRFRALPGARRHAARHDRPCRLHGHRCGASRHHLARS